MRPEMRPELTTVTTAPLTNEGGEVRKLTEEDFRGMRPLAEVDPATVELVEA
jgi:hypothetical protein